MDKTVVAHSLPALETELSPAANSRQEFRRSWHIVLATLVGVGFGVNGFSYAAFGVFVNPLAQAFGRSISAISGWVTFLFLGCTAVSPFIGMLADRIGARRVILLSIPLFALTLGVAGAIGTQLWMLYLIALAAGSIGTGASPVTYGRVVNTWFETGRGAALGIMSSGIGLSYLFGPRLVQSIVDAHGWRLGFFFMAVAHLLPVPLMVFWLRERREMVAQSSRTVETGHTVREAVHLPVFWCAGAAFLLYGLCAGGVTLNMIPFLTASGLSRASAATYVGLLGVFSVTGRVVTGFVIDRLHVAFVCAIILLMEAVAFAAFGWFETRFVVMAISVTGFAFGGEISCMGYAIARYFGVKHYGAIYGLLSVVCGIGVGLGPPVFSFLREISGVYSVPFFVSAGLAVGAAAFFAILGIYPFFKGPMITANSPT